MGSIELSGIEKWFGEAQVIKGIELNIKAGEFIIFVGPSGCGKSTLLRMIGGLEETSRGKITLNGRDVTDEPPAKRGLSMVFQSYALYPHMSVKENMGFSLKTAGKSKDEIREKVKETAKVLRLEKLLDRHPKDLSGGQRQRIALARALAPSPQILLLDEPFSNLDAELRTQLAAEVRSLLKKNKVTALMVTHDQDEAFAMADKIALLNAGNVVQVDTPYKLYHKPGSLFAADFIGKGAVINVGIDAAGLLGNNLGSLSLNTLPEDFGNTVKLLVRPDDIAYDDTSDTKLEIVSKTDNNKVNGCASQVWIDSSIEQSDNQFVYYFDGESDDDADDYSLIGLFGGWSSSGLRLGLEYNSYDYGSLTDKLTSFYLSYKMSDALNLFARHDMLNTHDDALSSVDETTSMLGAIWSLTKGLYVSPNVVIEDDSNDYRLTFMFKY